MTLCVYTNAWLFARHDAYCIQHQMTEQLVILNPTRTLPPFHWVEKQASSEASKERFCSFSIGSLSLVCSCIVSLLHSIMQQVKSHLMCPLWRDPPPSSYPLKKATTQSLKHFDLQEISGQYIPSDHNHGVLSPVFNRILKVTLWEQGHLQWYQLIVY